MRDPTFKLVAIKRNWVPEWLFAIAVWPIDLVRIKWLPFRRLFTEPCARCRWCDRNDIPLSRMAIGSFKASFDMFAGVCKTCFEDPDAERKYHLRMEEMEK